MAGACLAPAIQQNRGFFSAADQLRDVAVASGLEATDAGSAPHDLPHARRLRVSLERNRAQVAIFKEPAC